MTSAVTVIIPTLATRPRGLTRAITSVQNSLGPPAIPLVIVNGNRSHPGLISDLRSRSDIRLHEIREPGVSRARYEGARRVDTPYFAFLDDDDELLPDGLPIRLAGFEDGRCEVVVTNGLREIDGQQRTLLEHFPDSNDDLCLSLMREIWLASAGGMFRTDRVKLDVFRDLPDHVEMTLLAFRLAMSYRIRMIDRPTFVIHSGSSDQASGSWTYHASVPRVLESMERMTDRPDVLSLLRKKRSSALHACAEVAMNNGDWKMAWRYHGRSLLIGGGMRHLTFSRHLLLRMLQDRSGKELEKG